mgnify:CR=1 FL=1
MAISPWGEDVILTLRKVLAEAPLAWLLFAVPVLGLLGDVVGTATRTRLTPRGPILAGLGLAGLGWQQGAVRGVEVGDVRRGVEDLRPVVGER